MFGRLAHVLHLRERHLLAMLGLPRAARGLDLGLQRAEFGSLGHCVVDVAVPAADHQREVFGQVEGEQRTLLGIDNSGSVRGCRGFRPRIRVLDGEPCALEVGREAVHVLVGDVPPAALGRAPGDQHVEQASPVGGLKGRTTESRGAYPRRTPVLQWRCLYAPHAMRFRREHRLEEQFRVVRNETGVP